jgi:hypothetical protein
VLKYRETLAAIHAWAMHSSIASRQALRREIRWNDRIIYGGIEAPVTNGCGRRTIIIVAAAIIEKAASHFPLRINHQVSRPAKLVARTGINAGESRESAGT